MEKQSVYKLIRPLIILIYIVLAGFAFKFVMEYVFRWIVPFIIGFLLSLIALPLSRFFVKKLRMKKKLASFIAASLVVLACLAVIGLFILAIYTRMLPFFARLSDMSADISARFSATWDKILSLIDKLPPSVADSVKGALTALPEKIDFVNIIVVPLLNAAGSLPVMLLSVIATFVSTFLFVIDSEAISAFIKKAVKPTLYEKIRRTTDHLFSSLFKWLKAQVILCSVCFGELLIGFLILGLEHPLLLAALICFIDFLPVLGAGTVLIPWALIALMLGNLKLAIGLAVIYIVILIVRNMLEPNVVGIQIGMHPLVTLFGIYVGFRMYGFIGMFILPLVLITVIQLNRWGYIKLWDADTPPSPENEILSVEKK